MSIDLSERQDGGLLKTVKRHGTDPHRRPSSNCNATIGYVAIFEDGHRVEQFESLDAFEFKPGENGQVPRGLAEGVRSMRPGELAILEMRAEYGYGEEGNLEKGIPPNATLLYVVELLGLKDDGAHVEKMSIGTVGTIEHPPAELLHGAVASITNDQQQATNGAALDQMDDVPVSDSSWADKIWTSCKSGYSVVKWAADGVKKSAKKAVAKLKEATKAMAEKAAQFRAFVVKVGDRLVVIGGWITMLRQWRNDDPEFWMLTKKMLKLVANSDGKLRRSTLWVCQWLASCCHTSGNQLAQFLRKLLQFANSAEKLAGLCNLIAGAMDIWDAIADWNFWLAVEGLLRMLKGLVDMNAEHFPRLHILQQYLGEQTNKVSEPIDPTETIWDWITALLKKFIAIIGAKIEEFGDYVMEKGTKVGEWAESKGDIINDVGNKTKDFGTVLQKEGHLITGSIVRGVGYGIQAAGIAVKAVGSDIKVASEAIGGAIKEVGSAIKRNAGKIAETIIAVAKKAV